MSEKRGLARKHLVFQAKTNLVTLVIACGKTTPSAVGCGGWGGGIIVSVCVHLCYLLRTFSGINRLAGTKGRSIMYKT